MYNIIVYPVVINSSIAVEFYSVLLPTARVEILYTTG